jgi:hypothetical protein
MEYTSAICVGGQTHHDRQRHLQGKATQADRHDEVISYTVTSAESNPVLPPYPSRLIVALKPKIYADDITEPFLQGGFHEAFQEITECDAGEWRAGFRVLQRISR